MSMLRQCLCGLRRRDQVHNCIRETLRGGLRSACIRLLVIAFVLCPLGLVVWVRSVSAATEMRVINIDGRPGIIILDNVFDGALGEAGAAAGYIGSDKTYVIDFGAKAAADTGASWGLSFGRGQSAQVGDVSDFVFGVQSDYSKPITVRLVERSPNPDERGQLGPGAVIRFVNVATGAPQWTLTGTADPSGWTISGEEIILERADIASFYLEIKNIDAAAGAWSPLTKFEFSVPQPKKHQTGGSDDPPREITEEVIEITEGEPEEIIPDTPFEDEELLVEEPLEIFPAVPEGELPKTGEFPPGLIHAAGLLLILAGLLLLRRQVAR